MLWSLILHLESCTLPALCNCCVIIFHLICKGECVPFPLLQGTKLENMYNSKIGPVKAHNFHLIKGSEQKKFEISLNKWPAACFSLAFSKGIQCIAEYFVNEWGNIKKKKWLWHKFEVDNLETEWVGEDSKKLVL